MLRFDEAKATQAAARFIALRGGQIHYLKLIKLLYIADREALLRWGIPITTDRYVSMDHGPVVSRIYSMITEERPKPIWEKYISAPMGEYEVKLLAEAPDDKLSRAEEKLIEEVFQKYGHWSRWKLRDFVHRFPEWKDPQGSSTPIHIKEILRAGGGNDDDIRAIIAELRSMTAAEEALSSV